MKFPALRVDLHLWATVPEYQKGSHLAALHKSILIGAPAFCWLDPLFSLRP